MNDKHNLKTRTGFSKWELNYVLRIYSSTECGLSVLNSPWTNDENVRRNSTGKPGISKFWTALEYFLIKSYGLLSTNG